VRTVPGVRKAVKWNSPFYGVERDGEKQGWFLSFHCFTKYVKVAFFRGASLRPVPPSASKHEDVRYLDIYEEDQIDEAQLTAWVKQASKLPGMRRCGGMTCHRPYACGAGRQRALLGHRSKMERRMTSPTTMKAVVIAGKGGPEVLELRDVPVPQPGPGEILIKVAAAGVNRPDVLQRQGSYPPPKGHSELPGLEVSGVVEALGDGVQRFASGDEVLALVNGGGYAQYVVTVEACAIKKPPALSFEEAAAIPETFFTVWHNVFERGGLKDGETFLVHGGTSGIGVTAIQIAKAFGARVITTAGSDEKCEAARALGADIAINYRTQDFVQVVKNETKRGVNVILDMVGGDYIAKNIRCLADDGRLINIGYQNGSTATVDFMRVMLKRLTLTGSTLRIRPTEVIGRIANAIEERVLPLVVAGKIKIPIDSTFPLARASEAHARMESGAHIGKIVLTV
jgi:NADPH2:quinone reductase